MIGQHPFSSQGVPARWPRIGLTDALSPHVPELDPADAASHAPEAPGRARLPGHRSLPAGLLMTALGIGALLAAVGIAGLGLGEATVGLAWSVLASHGG